MTMTNTFPNHTDQNIPGIMVNARSTACHILHCLFTNILQPKRTRKLLFVQQICSFSESFGLLFVSCNIHYSHDDAAIHIRYNL